MTSLRTTFAVFACSTALLALSPAPSAAQDTGQIIGDVIEGVTGGGGNGGDRQTAERAAAACEEAAQDEDLRVRSILEAREAGSDTIEVTLRAEDDRDEALYVCTYDRGDERVEDFAAAGGPGSRDGRDLAERAEEACTEMAGDRDLDEIDIGRVDERSDDLLEVSFEAEEDGDNRDFTCLYDVQDEQAFMAD